jgi:hypothetical protein
MDAFDRWLTDRISRINQDELADSLLINKVVKIIGAFSSEEVADLVKFCNLIIRMACLSTLESVRLIYRRLQ